MDGSASEKAEIAMGGPYWVVERYGDGTFELGTM